MINSILNLFCKKEKPVEEYIKVPLKTDLEEINFYRLINTPFINNKLNTIIINTFILLII